MERFNFELLLIDDYPSGLQADEFLDHVEDALFEAFEGSVTPAMMGGVPMLYCTIEAASAGEAFDKVSAKVLDMGLHPTQLLMNLDPNDRYALPDEMSN